MQKNIEYIVLENLPSFEKYHIVDINETIWGDTIENNMLNDKNTITTDRLYIKGINRISYNSRKIEDYSVFLEDYLSLGRRLFELATSKNTISFSKPLSIDNIDIIDKYIEEKICYPEFFKKHKKICDEIFDMVDSIDCVYENDDYNCYISNLMDRFYTIINFLTVLDIVFHYDVKEELHTLSDFLVDYHYFFISAKSSKDLENVDFNDLDELIKSIENICKENNFDLKQLVQISGEKSKTGHYTNYVDLYNNLKFSPIDIKFTTYQLKKLRAIIIKFLTKYGFPYFVKKKDEKKYREEINIFSKNTLDDNEYLIPCEHLIVNSIYNYIIYSLLIDQQEADPIIKKTFELDEKLTANKRKEVNEIRKSYNYYMNNVCDRIFGLKINSYNINSVNNVSVENNSYFKTSDGDVEIPINNLCIAANEIIKKETKYILLNDKKYCPVCKKWKFPYEFKYRKYCSNKCQKKGNTRQATLEKRRRRKSIDLLNRIFYDDE